jgi:hypothetical protein
MKPGVIGTDTSSSFVCDYVAGINRVLSLPGYLLIDNIGRNFELWHFRSGEPEPNARARYDLTSYPDDPIASLLDVDIHAAFLRREGRELIAINHYGRARGFEFPAPSALLRPAWECQLLGDMERVVMAGDCFIGSSPRGEYTDDPARPGVFLFEPIRVSARLGADQMLADWGIIGAVAVSNDHRHLVVAAGQRLGTFELSVTGAGLSLGSCLWEAALAFHCQWLHIDDAGSVWTGGPRPSANDGEEPCNGGGVQRFDLDSRADDFRAALPEETAWGYGADPVVLAAGSRTLYVLGRDASLHVIDVSGSARTWCPALAGPASDASLGIGHAAIRNDRIYAGFSRGGFRLLTYDVSSG